ncbi:hypothetical protein BKA01_003625 [Pseudonocardia eucalypti]|nr:hypothetical protein [Pseudonocardia eucalypti]
MGSGSVPRRRLCGNLRRLLHVVEPEELRGVLRRGLAELSDQV